MRDAVEAALVLVREVIGEKDARKCSEAVDVARAIILMALRPISCAIEMLQWHSDVGGYHPPQGEFQVPDVEANGSPLDVLRFNLREISAVIYATHHRLGASEDTSTGPSCLLPMRSTGSEMGNCGEYIFEKECGNQTYSLWHAVVGSVKGAHDEWLLDDWEAAMYTALVRAAQSGVLAAAHPIKDALDITQKHLDDLRHHRMALEPLDFKSKEDALKSLQSGLRDMAVVVIDTCCLGSSDMFLPALWELAKNSTNPNLFSQLRNAFTKLSRHGDSCQRKEAWEIQSKAHPPSPSTVAYVALSADVCPGLAMEGALQPAPAKAWWRGGGGGGLRQKRHE